MKKRRGKYNLPRARKKQRGKFLPLILFLVVITGVWFWWQTRPHQKSPVPSQTKSKPIKQSSPENIPETQSTRTQSPFKQPAPVQSVSTSSLTLPKISNNDFPRPVRDGFEAQVALERLHISAGSIDGVIGSQTRAAILAFQRNAGLAESGTLDGETRTNLQLTVLPLTTYAVTSNDLARLQPVGKTWLAKSQQDTLDYETLLELIAERSHAHPNLIARLNPDVDWTNVVPGAIVKLPDVNSSEPAAKAAFIIISLSGKTLDAYDTDTNLLAHFPCSIAQRVEKRPVGELHVAVVAPNPNYTFDPDVFPESEEARQLKMKLMIPPGPNNPVGVAWIGLDKPGYGMHGTPKPEDVGRTESHGCFRLANWNAEYLVKLVWVGLPVYVEP